MIKAISYFVLLRSFGNNNNNNNNFKLLKMYQFVQNKLVLIHEQININITEHIKMIIKGKIQSYHIKKDNYLNIILTNKSG